MEKISSLFDNNPWLNIAFLILSLISIYLAIYYYYKSVKEKRPVYNKQSTSVIRPDMYGFEKLQIKYKDTDIKSLTLTQLAFWNAGRETIGANDFTSKDPLTIKTGLPNIIYDYELGFNNHVNNIEVKKINDQTIGLGFEFLDYNQGFVISIYHSGGYSDIEINGTFVGANKIVKGVQRGILEGKLGLLVRPLNKMSDSKNWVIKISGYLIAVLFLVILLPLFIVFGLLDLINDEFVNKQPKEFLFKE